MRFTETDSVLITCALPYVNNIPHLGNLVPIISADVYSRFLKKNGIKAIYICATDEHGTRTELEAKKQQRSPAEYCLDLHEKIKSIFEWFNIDFDYFGRTSDIENHHMTQHIFKKLYEKGYVFSDSLVQLYCSTCGIYLPDTFVLGICPYCNTPDANGDQCDVCGKFLDPVELVEPRCKTCGNIPEKRESRHLFLDLPKLSPLIEQWLLTKKEWQGIIMQLPLSWIKKGLKSRCITRDLEWGVRVPLEGYENKVFYVWFDAPIGYIGSTIKWAEKNNADWKNWWKNEDTKLIHFLGKDNVPFHTLMWPGSLLGADDGFNLPYYISANEYLNYEGGHFSKSRNRGIFSNDITRMEFPEDFWRFYVIRKRPEKADTDFSWEDFASVVNTDLIQNFANYVNRTLKFTYKNYGCIPSEYGYCLKTLESTAETEHRIKESFFNANLRTALNHIMELCDAANRYYQEKEPWSVIKKDDREARKIVFTSILLLEKIMNYLDPVIPDTCEKIRTCLGIKEGEGIRGLERLREPEALFSIIDSDRISGLSSMFRGKSPENNDPGWASFSKDAQITWECIIIEFKDIEIRKKAGALQKLKKDTIGSLDIASLEEAAHIKKYYEAFDAHDRGKAVPSPVNLINIVKKSANIPNINTLVDIYNLISLKYGVVMGAYDRRAVKGRIMYKVAEGDEVFIPVKNKQKEKIYPGEWVICDESNMVITRMLSKQSEAVAVGKGSRDAVICIQGNPLISHGTLKDMAEELTGLVKEFCGGRHRILYSPE